VCPYKAIAFDAEKGVAVINAVLCMGCGTCVAACPTGAIKGIHFTNDEILAEISEVLA
jgi:heterodisulfide reductase subunit A